MGAQQRGDMGDQRPATAKSWRSSNSAYGAGLRGKSAYSNTKSRYKQARPQSAPVNKSEGREHSQGGTGTASRFVRHNGDNFGVLHPHKLTGYKMSEKQGENIVSFMGTTNRDDFKQPSLTTIADPNKACIPYHPTARRSMLPVVFPHEAKNMSAIATSATLAKSPWEIPM